MGLTPVIDGTPCHSEGGGCARFSGRAAPSLGMCAYGHGGYVQLYPNGVQQIGVKVVGKRRGRGGGGGGKRGEIDGLSLDAARRMRVYLLTHNRPGCVIYNVSLTVPGEYDAELWERMIKRLRNDAIRAGVSYVYRIELQKRKVPHLHVVAWVPDGTMGHRIFTEKWLEYLPDDRRNMQGVLMHCVVCRPGNENNIEWYAYLVSHACKKKISQLGYKGKQWGIVGRNFMLKSRPQVYDFSKRQRLYFQRTLRKMIVKAGGKCKEFPAAAGYVRIIDPERVRSLLDWILKHVEK
jgi:hypothetical protein